MQNYSVLAKYYDRFTQNDCDYESWSQYLCKVAASHGVRQIVDVACGTGKMTAILSGAGYKLIAVDGSREMLQEATSKCRALFVEQDMKTLVLPGIVDMAVVVNDGVNYLKPAELAPFFTNLSRYLREGAPLVFDLSTPYKLCKVVGNNVFFLDDADATLLWTNSQKGNAVKMEITIFERQGNGETYLRRDETHVQYAYAPEEITEALRQAGFQIVEITSDYGKPLREDCLRHTYYAIKI